MKLSVKILSALLLVMVVCSCASAALPSVTMLSTKTCPACKQMESVLKEIASRYAGKIATEHVDVHDNPDVAKKYEVRYVPTLLFKNAKGEVVAMEIGYRDIDAVIDVFRKNGITF